MIRTANPADVPAVLALIGELAAYEREPDAVEATEELLYAALFGDSPAASCHVGEQNGTVVGFALWYPTFSTWTGRPGLWLEDLYIRPTARRDGIGTALLATLAQVCVQRGWSRFEWWVLDWNSDAHDFYRSLGASPQAGWTTWRLDGDDLRSLAARPRSRTVGS